MKSLLLLTLLSLTVTNVAAASSYQSRAEDALRPLRDDGRLHPSSNFLGNTNTFGQTDLEGKTLNVSIDVCAGIRKEAASTKIEAAYECDALNPVGDYWPVNRYQDASLTARVCVALIEDKRLMIASIERVDEQEGGEMQVVDRLGARSFLLDDQSFNDQLKSLMGKFNDYANEVGPNPEPGTSAYDPLMVGRTLTSQITPDLIRLKADYAVNFYYSESNFIGMFSGEGGSSTVQKSKHIVFKIELDRQAMTLKYNALTRRGALNCKAVQI